MYLVHTRSRCIYEKRVRPVNILYSMQSIAGIAISAKRNACTYVYVRTHACISGQLYVLNYSLYTWLSFHFAHLMTMIFSVGANAETNRKSQWFPLHYELCTTVGYLYVVCVPCCLKFVVSCRSQQKATSFCSFVAICTPFFFHSNSLHCRYEVHRSNTHSSCVGKSTFASMHESSNACRLLNKTYIHSSVRTLDNMCI